MTDGRRGLAGCLATVALAAACTADAGPPPLVAPLTVAAEPAWVGSADLFSSGRFPELRGDSLIVYGPGKEEAERDRALAVVDVATGRQRWRLARGGLTAPSNNPVDVRQEKVLPLDPAAGSGEWVVVAPYQADPATGQNGVVALSGTDGRVVWRTPLDPQRGVEYIAPGDGVAVSVLRSPDAGESLVGSRVVATDAADGSIRWESAGLWPAFVTGDTVLGIEADELVPLEPEVRREATVVALDAATGARKWDLSDRYARSNVYLTLGDVAVIGTADERGENQRSRVIDAHTGEELADLGAPLRCVGDQVSLILCAVMGGRDITIFDADRREKSVLRGVMPSGGVNPVRGYLFRGDDVVDREGTVVSTRRLGFVVAMSDRYLVTFPHRFEKGKDTGKMAVYPIEK